ncbi:MULTISPECIES: hypothetical protein [Sphingomonas]|uniref:hypothetical protein n=1 Tax=Sphingomonas TaxID=13687 RepID=UPI000ADE007C|nr:hypothetical protein [Sphingomonas sp. CCH10-B3]
MRPLMLIPLLLVVSCAETPRQQSAVADQKAADQTKLARLLQGYTPGEPVTCLPQQSGQYRTTGVGDTLLYSNGGRVIYRNDTTGCSGVERGDVLLTRTNQSRLCRGQIASTFDAISRNPTGSCSFGDFIPYRKNQ